MLMVFAIINRETGTEIGPAKQVNIFSGIASQAWQLKSRDGEEPL